MRKFLIVILFIWVLAPAIADDCPDGYSIIDDSGLCKVECPDGWYVKNAGEVCAQIPGTSPYYAAKHTVAYGETSGDNVKKCPEPDPVANGTILSEPKFSPSASHSSINQCMITRYIRYSTKMHGTMQAPCYYTTGDDGHAIYDERTRDPVTGARRSSCVGSSRVISCDPGYYAHCTYSGDAPEAMGCQPVGYNYYSPDGDLKRYQCPNGTMTCGYGDCADSIDDCVPYKTLHIGEDASLVMGAVKYMSPSLAARGDDGNVYYAQSTTANVATPHLRFVGDDGIKRTLINPLEQFTTVVRSYGSRYAEYCENGETTYTHIVIP